MLVAVGEDHQPAALLDVREVLALLLQRGVGPLVECGDVGERHVTGRRHQVAKIRNALAARVDEDRLMSGTVAVRDPGLNAGNDLGVAAEQLDLARLFKNVQDVSGKREVPPAPRSAPLREEVARRASSVAPGWRS